MKLDSLKSLRLSQLRGVLRLHALRASQLRLRSILRILLAILAVGIALELIWPLPGMPPLDEEARRMAVQLPQSTTLAFSEYSAVLATRRLFKPSTPIEASPYGRIGVQKAMEGITFSGVIPTKRGTGAVISVPGKPVGTYYEGDMIGDLKVVKIERDALTLALGEEQAVLRR